MTRSNSRHIGELIKDVLKSNRLEDKITGTRIMAAWEKVMGVHIARYTESVSVKRNILTVHLRSSVMRNELEYARSKIILMINKELGEEVIKEVTFR